MRLQRNLTLSPLQIQAIKGWGPIVNILGGAYIGGLIVCLGLLYFLYYDADSRQPIPFELLFANQISAVKALNKDDVLKSPRYAVKHYRRLLLELAKHEDKNLEFDESDPINKYRFPLIDSETLVFHKSKKFSNFYIDMVSRYAQALLAKGELDVSIEILHKLVFDDEIFFRLGDSERLSQCARLLTKITPGFEQKLQVLERNISMIKSTFPSIALNKDYLLQANSTITNELISCLDDLAFIYARESKADIPRKQQDQWLTKSLNIYMSNLKAIQQVSARIQNGEATQNTFPLFNCQTDNITILMNEQKSHISEIIWSKGFRNNAIAWNEQIVDDIYYMNSTSSRVSTLLYYVLLNLISMYQQLNNPKAEKRCLELKRNLNLAESSDTSWYDATINRFCRIIYNQGPLGVLSKGVSERFGPSKRIPELEEFEDEDEEV